jgi:hypothetical protein
MEPHSSEKSEFRVKTVSAVSSEISAGDIERMSDVDVLLTFRSLDLIQAVSRAM